MTLSEADKAKLELIEEIMEITCKRNCYLELRIWLKGKKFEIENQ